MMRILHSPISQPAYFGKPPSAQNRLFLKATIRRIVQLAFYSIVITVTDLLQ